MNSVQPNVPYYYSLSTTTILISLESAYLIDIIKCFLHKIGMHEWDKDRKTSFKVYAFDLEGHILVKTIAC
jgi:hypothetical protein